MEFREPTGKILTVTVTSIWKDHPVWKNRLTLSENRVLLLETLQNELAWRDHLSRKTVCCIIIGKMYENKQTLSKSEY